MSYVRSTQIRKIITTAFRKRILYTPTIMYRLRMHGLNSSFCFSSISSSVCETVVNTLNIDETYTRYWNLLKKIRFFFFQKRENTTVTTRVRYSAV